MRCCPGSPHYLANPPWPSISRIRCLLSGSRAQRDSTHCRLNTSQPHELQLQMHFFFHFFCRWSQRSGALHISRSVLLVNQIVFQLNVHSNDYACSAAHCSVLQQGAGPSAQRHCTLQPIQHGAKKPHLSDSLLYAAGSVISRIICSTEGSRLVAFFFPAALPNHRVHAQL